MKLGKGCRFARSSTSGLISRSHSRGNRAGFPRAPFRLNPRRTAAGNTTFVTNAYWVGEFATQLSPSGSNWTNETQNYAYDSAGCLTNRNGVSLKWDERYRLTSAVRDSVFDILYSYDVLGRRISRSAGGSPATVAEHYIYDGNQIAADLDADGNVIRTYVWGPGIDNLLSFTDHASNVTYHAIKDHQNSILAFVDSAGKIAETYEYTAYGEIRVFNSAGQEIAETQIGNRYTFQGREYDWTTGLIYFRARWYDPETGRWLSKDPIGIAGGLNLYEFCGSNPVNFVDPSGLCKEVKKLTWATMMGHYIFGKGDVKIPISEIMPKGGFRVSDFNKDGVLVFDTNGPAGRVVFVLENGVVTARSEAFDFDGRPWGVRDPGGFPYIKEVSTRIGDNIPGGESFDMHFTGSVLPNE